MIKHEEQTGEINLAQKQTYRWHDDSFDQGCHDLSEGGADDHGDGEIDYISAGKKFFEFFQHDLSPLLLPSLGEGWGCGAKAGCQVKPSR